MGRGRCVGTLVCSSHEWRGRVEVEVEVVRVVVVNNEGDIAPWVSCSRARNRGCLALAWAIFGVVGAVELKVGDMVAIVVDWGDKRSSVWHGKSLLGGGEVMVALALVG